MHVAEFAPAVALVSMMVDLLLLVRRTGGRTIPVVAALALAGHAGAQVSARGVPGGMLSTTPGVGGVGVLGQVPGGTLSMQPGIGGLGVPGQLPGGTLGTNPPCGYGPCNLLVPWLATGTPGAYSAPNAYNAGATP